MNRGLTDTIYLFAPPNFPNLTAAPYGTSERCERFHRARLCTPPKPLSLILAHWPRWRKVAGSFVCPIVPSSDGHLLTRRPYAPTPASLARRLRIWTRSHNPTAPDHAQTAIGRPNDRNGSKRASRSPSVGADERRLRVDSGRSNLQHGGPHHDCTLGSRAGWSRLACRRGGCVSGRNFILSPPSPWSPADGMRGQGGPVHLPEEGRNPNIHSLKECMKSPGGLVL